MDKVTALRRTIEHAFAATPHPGNEPQDISTTEHDEGTVEHFAGTTWKDHDPASLHYHSCALSFFTPAAYRYWLPAFMLAELDDPDTADIIADIIADTFARSNFHIRLFESGELEAIAGFLEVCHDRYGASSTTPPFSDAAQRIRRHLHKRANSSS